MKKTFLLAGIITLAITTPAIAAPAPADDLGSYASWTVHNLTPAATADVEVANGTFSFDVLNAPGGTFTVTKEAADGEDSEVGTAETEYMSTETSFGAEFGASGPSADIEFLKTRVDGVLATGSVTTLTFDSAMPAGVFGVALSDLDYDEITIDATDGSGNALTGADMHGDSFNFCDVTTSVPDDCYGDTDKPTWRESRSKFAVDGTGDSDGATGTIAPTKSVKTMTLTHVTPANSSFRTWMAVKTGVLCGTISGLGSTTADLALSFDGTELATTSTASDGRYCFPKALAVGGYSVKVTVAENLGVKDGATRDISFAAGDVTQDFEVTEVLANTGLGQSLWMIAVLTLAGGFALLAANRKRNIA